MKKEEVFREEIPRPYSSFINELEEKNRKLKDERDMLVLQQMWAVDHLDLLEKDNKKLKENNDKLKELVKIPCTSYTRDLEKENKELNEKIRFLEQCLDNKEKVNKSLREDNKKLKNSIEYRKKKAESNQEKANQIDKIMNLPWVMVDWKIDWSKVAFYYCI